MHQLAAPSIFMQETTSGTDRPAYGWAVALTITLIFLIFNLSTLTVGLPSSQKAQNLFRDGQHQQVVPVLKQLRDKLYQELETKGFYKIVKNFSIDDDERPLHICRSFLLQAIYPDETQPVRALQNINPNKLQFNPRFHEYGPMFFYSAGAAMYLGYLFKLYPHPREIDAFIANPDFTKRLWSIPRILSMLSIAAAALVMFFTIRLLAGINWGLFAAVVTAAAPVLQMEAHYLKPYNQSALMNAVTLLLMLLSHQRRQVRYLYMAAVSAALSTGFLPTSGVFVILLAATAWITRRNFSEENAFWKTIAVLAVAGALFNPWAILEPREVIRNFSEEHTLKPQLLVSVWGWFKIWLITYPQGATLPLFLAALVGLVAGVVRKSFVAIICTAPLLMITPFFALHFNPHYISSVYPALVILAVWGLLAVQQWSRRVARIGATVIILAVLAQFAFYQITLKRSDAIQLAAGAWINDNIPPGSVIGSRRITPIFPPFRILDYKIVLFGDAESYSLDDVQTVLPSYYIAREPDAVTESEWFRREYRQLIAFPLRTPFDAMFTNTMFPLLSHTFVVYQRVKAGS
jgi:hypothetical protein